MLKSESCEYEKPYIFGTVRHAHDKQEKIDKKIAQIFDVKTFLSRNLSDFFFGGHIV